MSGHSTEDQPAFAIRSATAGDGAELAAIYNPYISSTVITFEEHAVSNDEMAARVADTLAEGLPWLVAEADGRVVGYAYASKWKGRCAYRFAVEITAYLADDVHGRGLGSRLYANLFEELRQRGMHTVIAGIALPNPASIALHEKMGLSKVAHFSEVGYKFDRWIDVGYWQATL